VVRRVQEGRDHEGRLMEELRVTARLLGATFVCTYSGGRLADIHLGGEAIHCIEVGSYDWNLGRQTEIVTETTLRLALGEWIDEDGATYLRQYAHLVGRRSHDR